MNNEAVAVRDANTASTVLVSGVLFGASVLITLAFGYLMVADPARLVDAWQWVRSLPLIVQIILWALFLPWMAALWVWSMPWALGVRIAVVSVLLVGATYLLFPWKR